MSNINDETHTLRSTGHERGRLTHTCCPGKAYKQDELPRETCKEHSNREGWLPEYVNYWVGLCMEMVVEHLSNGQQWLILETFTL